MKTDADILALLLSKTTKAENGCWVFNGHKDRQSYGRFSFRGKLSGAHRVSYALHVKNEIPSGLLVCHTCDNPPCINPAHLFLGTHKDNFWDAKKKGRIGIPFGPRGEDHYAAKLGKRDVRKIRRLLRSGKIIQADIASCFGVNQSTISRIGNIERWAHIK